MWELDFILNKDMEDASDAPFTYWELSGLETEGPMIFYGA